MRGKKVQLNHKAIGGGNTPHRLQQAGLAAIDRRLRRPFVTGLIAQRHRLDRHAAHDRSLQQRAMERQYLAAIARRAFGKGHHTHAFGQTCRQLSSGLVGGARRTAANIDRVGSRAHPAYQRPFAQIGFRDEGCRRYCVDGEHVQPRDVIRHVHQRGVGTANPQLHPEHFEQLPRPALLDRMAPALRKPRIGAEDSHRTRGKMQRNPQQPPDCTQIRQGLVHEQIIGHQCVTTMTSPRS